MIITGYILFVFIGIVLGLIGGGGSILGVPVLVYLLGFPADVATGYSLFIVGLTSLIGSYRNIAKGNISLESLLIFAIPSLITVFCVRNYLMPVLPEVIFTWGNFMVKKNFLIMFVFSMLMIFSSFSMIRSNRIPRRKEINREEFARSPLQVPIVISLGIAVGFLSGFVGAGGGFLIIPVLVFFVRVPIKKAIGTSLAIIAINSLIGFAGTFGHINADWKFLLTLSSLAIAGIIIGTYLNNFVSGKRLKPAFGWFTLVVGIFIVIKELVL
ncbi:MAG: sulfite exporter TauE/SafE family protein [Bacteroidia bacterium]